VIQTRRGGVAPVCGRFLSVIDLQKLKLSQWALNEKVDIKMKGRALPDIQI